MKNPKSKAIKIKKWEKEVGCKFPWGFPNSSQILLSLQSDWEKVVTDPASCTKEKIS